MSEMVIDFRKEQTFNYDIYADMIISDAVVAIQQGETPIFSVGDISTITGLAKSRKSFLIASLAVAFLKDAGFMGMESELQEKRVLLIDTEQSQQFVLRLMRRIYRMMGWDFKEKKSDLIRVLALRELTAEQRWDVVRDTIEAHRPNLVFIDGTADLVNDTNNQDESTKMVQNLMRLSSEKHCHICNVVHTNPNSEKSRGHFGSELQRKSETVLLLTKSDEITTVKPQFCRSIEFAPFSFRINQFGLPEQCDVIVKKAEDLSIIFIEIYSYAEVLSYVDLREQLMTKLERGKTACENRIKRATEGKIIYRDIEGLYRLNIEPREKEISFVDNNDPFPF